MKNLKSKKLSQKHPFHIVDPSPWPFLSSFAALGFVFGFVQYMHNYKNGGLLTLFSLGLLLLVVGCWARDIIREATFEGKHTTYVQRGIKIGFALFIFSEIMFFVAFFWAFLSNALMPSVEIGATWPPEGIITIDPWKIPLLNTLILLTSGLTITWAHYSLIIRNRLDVIKALVITIGLALIFTGFQVFEYIEAPFTISDGIYGSVFYMLTGCHGIHVLLGTLFILLCLVRHVKHHFTGKHHVGFECAIWYWHFVDIVWIFLFILLYWWGSA